MVISVPGPLAGQLVFEATVEHLHYIFADGGEKLPCMERASADDEEILAVWVRRNDPVLVRGDGIPVQQKSVNLDTQRG